MTPKAMIVQGDREYIVEEIDPDWKDHYPDSDTAFEAYWTDDTSRKRMIKISEEL